MIKDLFGILVIKNVSVTKIVIMVNIYLDYENCKCRKKLAVKLIDECAETIEEIKLADITFTENENNYECGSCKVYIVLMIILIVISTGITVYLVYYNWSLIKNSTCKNTEIWSVQLYKKWGQQNKY